MYKNFRMGYGILISLIGLNPAPINSPPSTTEQQRIRAEIQMYHSELTRKGMLLEPLSIYDPLGTRMKKRFLDPTTMKRIPDPPPLTQKEILEKFNELMKDPSFWKSMTEGKGII